VLGYPGRAEMVHRDDMALDLALDLALGHPAVTPAAASG